MDIKKGPSGQLGLGVKSVQKPNIGRPAVPRRSSDSSSSKKRVKRPGVAIKRGSSPSSSSDKSSGSDSKVVLK